MDTNIAELKAPQPAKKPSVFPCFQSNSTAHKVKDCPIATSMIKKEVQKQFKSMRGKAGKGNKGRGGGQGGKNKGKGSFPKNSENIPKKEPKN